MPTIDGLASLSPPPVPSPLTEHTFCVSPVDQRPHMAKDSYGYGPMQNPKFI